MRGWIWMIEISSTDSSNERKFFNILTPTLLILIMLIVAACGGGTKSTISFPLATDRPTFLFFFTDG